MGQFGATGRGGAQLFTLRPHHAGCLGRGRGRGAGQGLASSRPCLKGGETIARPR